MDKQRNYRSTTSLAAFLFGGVLVALLSWNAPNRDTQGPSAEISAKRIVLVDAQGKPAISLQVGGDGRAQILMFDGNGGLSAELSAGDSRSGKHMSPRIALFEPDLFGVLQGTAHSSPESRVADERVVISPRNVEIISPIGRASLSPLVIGLSDPRNEEEMATILGRSSLTLADLESSLVTLISSHGVRVKGASDVDSCTLGVENGSGRLVLRDEAGTSVISLPPK